MELSNICEIIFQIWHLAFEELSFKDFFLFLDMSANLLSWPDLF